MAGSRQLQAFAAAVLLLLSAVGLQAQYTFRSWQSEDGLPVNLVRSIVQAADGHILIATAEGITRFDGVEFERPQPAANFTYPASGPNRLFATPDGAVWFAGPDGDLLRIADGETTVIWRAGNPRGKHPVTQLIQTSTHGICICRGDEVWSYQDNRTLLIEPVPPALLALLEADRVARSRSGRIGVDGTPGQLGDPSGSLWSAASKGGLTTSEDGIEHPVSMPGVGPDAQVAEMLLDREGNIWVATAYNGVGLFRRERVNPLNAAAGLSANSVLGVIEDSRSQAWVGNRLGGVDRLRDGLIDHHQLLADGRNHVVSALFEDRDGRMWAASKDGPVFVWRDSSFVVAFADTTRPTKVNAIYHDKDGTLWFGGQSGLFRSTGRRVTTVEAEAGFPGGEVTAMTAGSSDELWLGTAQGFILRNAAGRLETVGTPGNLSYSSITAILVKDANQAWVTTMGAGLFLFDGSQWHRFDRIQGLPDLRLTSIIDDQLGYLWFGSIGGILRASQADLIARLHIPGAPIRWLRMDRSDGLPTRECVGGHQPAGWRFANGSIWFPTNLGMVRLDPSRTLANRTPPPVFLRSVRAGGGNDLSPGNEPIRVGPGRTRLEFRYHGLNFSAPEKITYRTRLIGLDATWREDGSQRLATYEAVPPGEYEFEVVAINGDGFESLAPASVRLEIRPHYWESRWFVAQATLVVVLLAGGVGWIIARNRLNRRINRLKINQARETERSRIARDLHDELGASLTEFSLLSDLGAERAVGSPYQSQIEQLSLKSRALGQALDEIVWAVNPREDSLASLINYLSTFAGEFLDRAGIALRLDIATGLPPLPLDTTVRHAVFLAVREAFNNLVKHSHARTAWLIVSYRHGVLEVVVEDDGCGVGPDAHTHGRGLTNFESHMSACHGRVIISPRPSGGTVVRFVIPLLANPDQRHQDPAE